MKAIDLFAGAGGFTTGACAAGIQVVWAANHWPDAVEIHRANHPDVEHSCQDLHQADWTKVPPHDILLASPACQGHSHARGKERSHHDASRSTAWAVVSAAEYHRPRAVVVENVKEFMSWGLYPAWLQAMSILGYIMEPHVIDAADHGVAQNRKRLFLVGLRDVMRVPLTLTKVDQHITYREIMDTSAPFTSRVDSLCRNTQERIANGRHRFGDRFITQYYSNDQYGRSIDRPLGTITTRDHHGYVEGEWMRMLTIEEKRRAMGFPASYVLPRSKQKASMMLGNAVVPPVATSLLKAVRDVIGE